ncbi:hypothetical protein [Actinophytocola sp.]|uniref:hypothetical protein n=1 Tax=Actinophytocola sp. TaxID=1872138 RepID=UPI002ED42E96
MRKRRTMRGAVVAAALAGAMMIGTSTPAWAYWIYHWDGDFATQETCLDARQTFIEQNTDAAQPFTVGPCGYHAQNPETGSGPAGWYYRWGISAA